MKNKKNYPIKLFSTGNNESDYNKQKIKRIDTNTIKGKNKNIKKDQQKFNSLLSTILNYDKIMNKSKYSMKKKQNISFEKRYIKRLYNNRKIIFFQIINLFIIYIDIYYYYIIIFC